MNSTEGAEENVRNVSDANSVIAEDSCVNDGGGTFGLPGLLFTVLLLVTLASLVLACRADERWARRYPADSRPVFACDGAACDRQPSLMAYLCSQLASLADPAWIPQELTYCALAREEHLALGTVRAVAEASWRCALHSCGTGRAASAGAVSMAPAHGVAGWDAVNQQVGAPETPLLPSERALSVCDAFWRSSLCRRLWVVFLALNPLLRWRRYSMFVSSRTRLLVVAGEVFGSLVVIVLYLGSECESGVPLLEDILLGALGAVFSVLLLVPVQLVLLRRGLACRQPRGQDTQEVRSEFSCPRPPKTATDAVLIAYLLFCALYLGLSVASAGPTTGTRAAVSGASSALGMVGLVPFCKAVLLSVGAALQQRREPGSLDAIRKLLRTLSVSSRREERIGDAILNRGSVTAEPEEPRKEELRDMLDAVAAVAKNIWSALQTFAGADLGVKATAAQVSSQCAPGQIEGFMAVVERQWEQKGRTLAQELCENLRQPRGSAPTTSPAASQGRAAGLSLDAELAAARADLPEGVAFLSLRRLAEVCRCVQRKYTRRHLHEDLQGRLLSTCCWVVYTMQDVDIDRLFGFPDCPVLPPGMEEPALRNAVYNEYRARCNGGRCPQMFSASNWAARVCFDRCGDVSSNIDRDALSGLQTWVKWLCFLGASARDLEVPITVTRGLCGLPEQLVNDFRRKQAGDSIFWAAPSSTTDDARVSDSYCNQQEPRERNVLFTISGVAQAFPMFELSQYPSEREWLLPPFCQLRVDRVVDGAPVQVECTFLGCVLSGSLRERVVQDLEKASQSLSWALAELDEELGTLRKKLREAEPAAVPGVPRRLREELLEARRARAELQASLDAATAQAEGQAASLERAAGAGVGAKSAAAEVSGQSSAQQVGVFMALIAEQWGRKERTLLQELCGNLRQPRGALGEPGGQKPGAGEAPAGSEALSLRTLASVCRSVQERYGHKRLHEDLQGHLLSICCWVLYTMQDVDIDRLFGFPDCPVLPPGMEEPALRNAVYNEYRARCNGGRCPQMFSVSNWAARVCFDTCGDVSSNIGRDALAGVQMWVKWLCFLGASARDLEVPVTVTRGLCGLPEQLVDDFRRKQAGDSIFWAAPSSTTDDARISDSYCNQQEPRERNVLFTVSGVTQAFPMFELSQYPKEREWLLPPFSQLRVDRVVDGAPVRVECTFVGCSLPGSLREGVVRDFKQASQDLGRVLAAMEGELSALRQQLERAKRRCTVSAKAVFRVHLRFLARASASGALPLQDLLDDFRSWQPPPPRGAPPRPSAEPPAGPCADAARAEESAEGAAQAALAGVLGGARRCEGVPEPPAVVPGSALDEAVQRAVARIRGGSGAREQALRKPVRKFERDGCTFCEVVLGEGPARSERLGFSFASGSAELARGLDGRVVADPTSQGVLVVRRVASGGLLNRWNLAHPVADVVAGDRIVEVNGVHGVRGMVRELRAPVVRMLVARYPERFHVELTQVTRCVELPQVGAQRRAPCGLEWEVEHRSRKELRITAVSAGGPLEASNRLFVVQGLPHYVVLPGMRIGAVNGVAGDVGSMAARLAEDRVVKLEILRGEAGARAKERPRSVAQSPE